MAKKQQGDPNELQLPPLLPTQRADKLPPLPKPNKDRRGAKTVSPFNLEEFRGKARDLVVTIDGQNRIGKVKCFSTGSYGWHFNEKITVIIDNQPIVVQCNCSLVVVGSKPEDREEQEIA